MSQFYPIAVLPLPPEDGPGYIGYALDLLGCMSHGDSPEEAFSNTRQAILEWIEEAKATGQDVPAPGSAAAAGKQERDFLLKTVTEQRAAIEGMDKNIREFKNEIDALRSALSSVFDRIGQNEDHPKWVVQAVGMVVDGRKGSNEDRFH